MNNFSYSSCSTVYQHFATAINKKYSYFDCKKTALKYVKIYTTNINEGKSTITTIDYKLQHLKIKKEKIILSKHYQR